jgi:transposase
MIRDSLQLTSSQRRQLQQQLHHPPDVRSYRRTLAILEIDQGQSIAEVADLLGVTRQSVYNWVEAYRQAPAPQSLLDQYGTGRPSLWTEPLQTLLLTCMDQRPNELGYAAVNWTVPLLREHLYRRGGQWLSDDTIRRQLDRLGYVWKRFRYVLPPDPECEKKTAHSQAASSIAAPKRQTV